MQPGILFIALIAALQTQYGARVSDAAISGYLDFDNLPETNFSCEGKVIGGYYADVETGCQMFHVCTIGQKGEVTDIKFLCLNGTVFDQETRVCERIDEVDCSQAEEFYGLNLELYGANAYIAGVSGSIIQEDLDDAANSEEVETSTIPSTTPTSTTTVAATTAATTTTTTTIPSSPPPRPATPSPPPKFIPPTPRPSPHQFGPTSPGTLSLLAFAQNQNHEGLPDVVPHQHQQIFHNSQRPQLHPSQPTKPPPLSTTRRPALNLNLKHQLTSNRPPLQQSIHPSHFPGTSRPTQLGQNHRPQQPPQPTLQSFKQYQQEEKGQQEIQRQKEEQQKQDQFSTHYFGNGYHKHNFQHHTQLPQSSPSSILSPSPSPSHLLSPPPSPSPSQASYHHTQPFHPLVINGLALEQQVSPSPTPSSPHQSFYSGHHFSTSVPLLREGKSLEQDDDPEAAHEAHTQHQQQLQQQHQQHIQQQHQQQIHQQQQQQIQQQQQQQIQQQKIEERQQQQIKQHQQKHHFPPPPTVAVVSSSSSTSTSHSSMAIVTGGLHPGVTSSTTTPNPPPVTSTSISISGPSGEGQSIIDHRLPVEPSGPSAEGSTEVYDEEYSDSDYSLDSFFDDVPKLRSDGRVSRRKRRDFEDERSSSSIRDGRRRGRGRSRYSSVPLQVSNAYVAVEPEKEQLPAVDKEVTPSYRVRNEAKPGDRVRISQVRASFRTHPVSEETQKGRQDVRRRNHLRNRQPQLEVPDANEKGDASVEPTTESPTTTMLPETSFICDDKVPGGLYADPETDCQLFHICSQGRHGKLVDNKFLCGPETRFNQQSRTCQAKEMVDCATSPSFYFLNKHFQHHILADVQVHPELQFEPLKVRKKRTLSSTDSEKLEIQQGTLQGGTSVDAAKHNSFRLQHCSDEKHCGNKWQRLINVNNFMELREKRDLANLSFDRMRSRFSLSARRTTTVKPKESTPLVLRFPNRNFLKPTLAPSRKVVSMAEALPERATTAPRSFVPSHSKFKRPPIVEQSTTEAPKRRHLFTRPTPNPVFSRRESTTTKSEENHDLVETNQKRDGKLPVTFRRHQILAQSKVPNLMDEVKVESKDITTKASVEFLKGVTEKPTNDEKNDEVDVQYDDEEYTDEEVRVENNVEGGHLPADTQGSNKADANFQSNTQKSDIKTDSKIAIIPPILGIQVDREKNDNLKKATFDDEEMYSDEYYDEEAENDDVENPQKIFLLDNQKAIKSTSVILPGTLKITSGRIYEIKSKDISESNVEESFEEESYEDEWESDEIDDTKSEKQDDPDDVYINNRNTMSNRKYFEGHTDVGVLSPHRTTLAAKHDSEFGLSEGEEDDFEETNRAVRKTSIGRRRNQALDNEGKKRKVVYIKASPEKSQEEHPLDMLGDKDDEDEKLKEDREEDDQYVSQIHRGISKISNDQSLILRATQRITSSSVNAMNNPKTVKITKKIPVNPDDYGLLPEDDEDYVEYDDGTSSKKSFPLENRKVSNKEIEHGSLLHLPIPLLKDENFEAKQDLRRNGATWENGEENYPFEQEDDEYTVEDNEGFQEDDEEYDDQEEGPIHVEKKGNEESYPDEEEEPMTVSRKIQFKNSEEKVSQINHDEEEYYDEEEEEIVGQDNSKGMTLKDDEYDEMLEDDNKPNDAKSRVISSSNHKKGTESVPLPYLRLVSPEEELTTRPSSTPNLFRTSKPRQRSWKQASAPEPPPVILPRRTTILPEIEKVLPIRGYSKHRERQGISGAENVDNRDKQSSRRWQPRQRGNKELSQNEDTTTNTFYPIRGRFTVNNDREDNQGGRSGQNLSAKKFRATRIFTTTPASAVRTTERITPSTRSNRISRPRLRFHIRKKISDEVQFSESQLLKSTHNLPLRIQGDDEDIEKYWTDNRGHKRTDKRKYISFNELPNSGRIESNTEPTLPTTVDFTPSIRDRYFHLSSTTSTPPGTFSCIGLEMYIYLADPLNPQMFHYCSPGFSRGQILDFRFSCVKGMSFSEEQQRCVKK